MAVITPLPGHIKGDIVIGPLQEIARPLLPFKLLPLYIEKVRLTQIINKNLIPLVLHILFNV